MLYMAGAWRRERSGEWVAHIKSSDKGLEVRLRRVLYLAKVFGLYSIASEEPLRDFFFF